MRDLKIFAENADPETLDMIYTIAGNSHFDDLPVRIMPDTHAGSGIVVGFTCPFGSAVNPEHIGVDIGCGIDIEFFDTMLPVDKFPIFEQRVRELVAMGKDMSRNREFDMKDFCRHVRKELSRAAQSSDGLVHVIPFSNERDITTWCSSIHLDEKIFYKSIGSLGGATISLKSMSVMRKVSWRRPCTLAAATSVRKCAATGHR